MKNRPFSPHRSWRYVAVPTIAILVAISSLHTGHAFAPVKVGCRATAPTSKLRCSSRIARRHNSSMHRLGFDADSPKWTLYALLDEDDGGDYEKDSDTSKRSNDDMDPFMASLKSRMAEVNDRATKLPLVVLDSMLPRQTLKIQVNNPLLSELVKTCIQNETPFFGMLGMARLITGEFVHLKRGVEVEMINPEILDDGSVRLELRGGRRFEILGELETAGQGWTEARVNFLQFETEEIDEIHNGPNRMAVARAISKATGLTSPNMLMEDNLSLVDRWIQLAKENERQSGQIDRLLDELGEVPPPEEPSNLAFWVGALINPLPPMGVATEIRPALLSAKTAESRVQVALDGILKSIHHMDGSKRLW